MNQRAGLLGGIDWVTAICRKILFREEKVKDFKEETQ